MSISGKRVTGRRMNDVTPSAIKTTRARLAEAGDGSTKRKNSLDRSSHLILPNRRNFVTTGYECTCPLDDIFAFRQTFRDLDKAGRPGTSLDCTGFCDAILDNEKVCITTAEQQRRGRHRNCDTAYQLYFAACKSTWPDKNAFRSEI